MFFHTERSLKEFCTFAIGGPAKYFCEVHSFDEMKQAFHFAREKKLPFFLLGKGSNILFDDLGYNGLVIQNRMEKCIWNKTEIVVESGYSFPLLGIKSAKKNLAGLEFAASVPASVGGAVYMNAGAHGQEVKDTVEKVWFLEESGEEKVFSKEEMQFSYRFSFFQKKKGAILKALFSLKEDSRAREQQKNWILQRMKTQPLKDKSAGCVFRNPSSELSVGKILEECGLKGFSLGGASISCKHANFIVNKDKASSQDVVKLIQEIQKKIYEKLQIRLQTEIKYVPYDG